MIVDLHNHTTLCNHATGTMQEYVEMAIQKNIKYFGFADHAPMDFDVDFRMSFEQMKSYEENILKLKQQYADKIEILLGYEVDFINGHMDDRVLNADVDYLIGSVHFLDKWGFDNPEFIGRYKTQDIDELWRSYFDAIKKMAQSKLFDIVGHLDLIKVFKYMPKNEILPMASEALQAIKDADMVLEINVAGFRKPVAEAYPSLELLKEANRLEIPITFASDAHNPDQVGLFNDEAYKLAKKAGYNECVLFRKRVKKLINFRRTNIIKH